MTRGRAGALSVTPHQELELEQVYSRGLGPHFITGVNHQKVVNGRSPRHRGVHIGTVTAVHDASVVRAAGGGARDRSAESR